MTSKPRSEATTRAARRPLDDERREAQSREYVEAYRRAPAGADDLALARAGAAALAQTSWDDDE
jgi:hypothetical protein